MQGVHRRALQVFRSLREGQGSSALGFPVWFQGFGLKALGLGFFFRMGFQVQLCLGFDLKLKCFSGPGGPF